MALAGGLLIGVAVLVLFHALGRIAGVSGIVTSTMRPSTPRAERAWRLAFLAGLVAGPLAARAVLGVPLIQSSPAPWAVLIMAGLAVGVGTGMANGCTSGHGVCGLSRLSARSMVATAVFMAAGVLTASILRHQLGT